MRRLVLAAVAASVGFAGASSAATLDFEEFTHGNVITSLNLGGGVTAGVTANGRSGTSPDQAWIFDTSMQNTNDPDLEGPFTDDGVNYDIYAGRALIIQEHDGAPDDDGMAAGSSSRSRRRSVSWGSTFLMTKRSRPGTTTGTR